MSKANTPRKANAMDDNSVHGLLLQAEEHTENMEDNLIKAGALLNGVMAFVGTNLPNNGARTEIEALLAMIKEQVSATTQEVFFLTEKLEDALTVLPKGGKA